MPEIVFLLGVPNLVYKTFIIKRNFLTLHCPTQLPAIGNSHNIGIESNVPGGLYVVLQDSAGDRANLKHGGAGTLYIDDIGLRLHFLEWSAVIWVVLSSP